MKHSFAALLTILLALSVAIACGGDGTTKPGDSTATLPDTDPDRLSITFSYQLRSGEDDSTWSNLNQMTKDGRLNTPFLALRGWESQAEWSNDGSKLLFTSGQPGYGGTIWVVNADLTGARQITDSPPGFGPEYGSGYGSWSPRGDSIAFNRTWGNTSGIAVMSADGTGLRWALQGGYVPSWSSTNRIAFSRDGFIWTMNPDGSGILRVTAVAGIGLPKWSRDGRRLVFLNQTRSANPNRAYDLDVVTIRADGSDRRTLVTGAFVQNTSWSPDGAYIVYDRVDQPDRQTSICTLQRVPAGGGASVDITPDRGQGGCAFSPAWRPL